MRFAQLSVWIGIISAAGFLLGLLLPAMGAMGPLAGLGLSSAGAALGVSGFVLAVIAALSGAFQESLIGLVTGGCMVAVVIVFFVMVRRYPPINDIVTDPASALSFEQAQSTPENQGKDLVYPGGNFTQSQQTAYPDIQPLKLSMPPDEAFAFVEKTARAMPRWQISASDPAAHRLEGFDTTALYGFRDDFVIQVMAADGGSVVQMRSRSRLGRGDVGVNANRIRKFFAQLKQMAD